MSQGYQIYDQNKPYYLTFQIVKWVDVFTKNELEQIISSSFDYCRKHKGLALYAYVIMTNHIHPRALVRVFTNHLILRLRR